MSDRQNPFIPQFNFEFRPRTYWHAQSIASFVHGTARRKLIQRATEAGLVDRLPAEVFVPNDRTIGRMHPSLMGGEYLPPLREREVNIAFITTKTTTCDAIAVRARLLAGNKIGYRVVNEYSESGDFYCNPEESSQPLSMRELISLIDHCTHEDDETFESGEGGLVRCFWDDEEVSSNVDERINFVQVESEFYPELNAYYRREARVSWREQWLKTGLPWPDRYTMRLPFSQER